MQHRVCLEIFNRKWIKMDLIYLAPKIKLLTLLQRCSQNLVRNLFLKKRIRLPKRLRWKIKKNQHHLSQLLNPSPRHQLKIFPVYLEDKLKQIKSLIWQLKVEFLALLCLHWPVLDQHKIYSEKQSLIKALLVKLMFHRLHRKLRLNLKHLLVSSEVLQYPEQLHLGLYHLNKISQKSRTSWPLDKQPKIFLSKTYFQQDSEILCSLVVLPQIYLEVKLKLSLFHRLQPLEQDLVEI